MVNLSLGWPSFTDRTNGGCHLTQTPVAVGPSGPGRSVRNRAAAFLSGWFFLSLVFALNSSTFPFLSCLLCAQPFFTPSYPPRESLFPFCARPIFSRQRFPSGCKNFFWSPFPLSKCAVADGRLLYTAGSSFFFCPFPSLCLFTFFYLLSLFAGHYLGW